MADEAFDERCLFASSRYMELVHTDGNFEPEESFFQLFSDPRSTRLTRVQLREDFVRDRDLEAIRKQVGQVSQRAAFQNKLLTYLK